VAKKRDVVVFASPDVSYQYDSGAGSALQQPSRRPESSSSPTSFGQQFPPKLTTEGIQRAEKALTENRVKLGGSIYNYKVVNGDGNVNRVTPVANFVVRKKGPPPAVVGSPRLVPVATPPKQSYGVRVAHTPVPTYRQPARPSYIKPVSYAAPKVYSQPKAIYHQPSPSYGRHSAPSSYPHRASSYGPPQRSVAASYEPPSGYALLGAGRPSYGVARYPSAYPSSLVANTLVPLQGAEEERPKPKKKRRRKNKKTGKKKVLSGLSLPRKSLPAGMSASSYAELVKTRGKVTRVSAVVNSREEESSEERSSEEDSSEEIEMIKVRKCAVTNVTMTNHVLKIGK